MVVGAEPKYYLSRINADYAKYLSDKNL